MQRTRRRAADHQTFEIDPDIAAHQVRRYSPPRKAVAKGGRCDTVVHWPRHKGSSRPVLANLDLEAFRAQPLTRKPFEHLVVPGFIRAAAFAAINAQYPKIETHGSFPVTQVAYGPAFQALLDELESDEFRDAFEEKFGLDLEGYPTTTTVRGRCGAGDGKIHTDSTSKIITVLVYMNSAWEHSGGRLRLLRSGKNLNDVILEVPPI